MTLTKERFAALLERARKTAETAKEHLAAKQAEMIAEQMEEHDVSEVDASRMGISPETLSTDTGETDSVEIIREVLSSLPDPRDQGSEGEASEKRILGVARDVTLNEKQQSFYDRVMSGTSVVLIGAAGTGKTTSMRTVTRGLIDSGKLPKLSISTKWLQGGNYGAVIVSYTRKAVNNIRHAVVDELKPHTITLHKLLEFAPVIYEIEDPKNPGMMKKTMRFEPQRNALNPLPRELAVVAFEEGSMIGTELYDQYRDAVPHNPQEIFLGDIQQLPPVFGLAILGFKMLELPVVELTEVYRQALNSPIISLAWKILEGNPHAFDSRKERYKDYNPHVKREVERIRVPTLDAMSTETELGKTHFQIWQKPLSDNNALLTATRQFCSWADSGYYNPDEDIILLPFNKSFGTVELNKGISNHLGKKRGARVFEVIAGFNKLYLAVGDRVLFDKEDAFIVDIAHNSDYLGKRAIPASVHLDRWGHMQEAATDEEIAEASADNSEMDMAAIEKLMTMAAADVDERVAASSHVVVIKYAYSNGDNEEKVLDKASEINNLLGGYALTVHKAQGSEWEKVFFVMHQSHAVMNQRELLYTAVTRAKKFLHIICEPDTFEKGIKSQAIKGNTIAEKAVFFKGKESEYEKKRKERATEFGTSQAGVYKGTAVPATVAISTNSGPKQPLVKLSEFVSAGIRAEAIRRLDSYWAKALSIWGSKIGSKPIISYSLQVSRKLGTANAATGVIKLNPVWCCAAEGDERVKEEMLGTTLIHEVCHIVANRFNEDNVGHASAWQMTMRMMGVAPDKVYMGDTLPPWAETMKGIVEETKEELGKLGGDLTEVESKEEGEVS